MNLQKRLRIAVAIHLLLLIVSIPVSNILNTYLPVQLQDYKLWVHEQGYTNMESVVSTILCIGHTISSIGLFFLKPWAKWSFSAFVAIMAILSPFLLGPSVSHALLGPIDAISSIALGTIFYMLFCTDVIPSKVKK